LVLGGESDAYDAERLRTTSAALPRTTVPLVIDLSRATFIDSTFAGVLLEQTRATATEGRAFAVFLPDTAGPHVRRMSEMTRLDIVLPLCRDGDHMHANLH